MWLTALFVLLLCSSLEAQENSFTINSISMESLASWTVQNGHNLTLLCIVDVSSTSPVKPQHLLKFYKDDVLIYNVSSTRNEESIFIPQARVFHSGRYKCTVILNKKEKTTQEYHLVVKGVPSPMVVLDKKEVIEGGVVTVNCSVTEEKPPIYFTIEKVEHDTKTVKQKREKNSNQNFIVMEFPIQEKDSVLFFRCKASIMSGINLESSESTRSELVTVRVSFSTPKFQVIPSGVITEGDQFRIKCTVQVTHLVQEFPEIIIQKGKEIVATTKQGKEAVYSEMALEKHRGNYTCKVESNRISKVSSILVNITELFPKPMLELSSILLDQGKELHFSCFIPGPSVPNITFTIEKEDKTIASGQSFRKSVQEKDSGTYTCKASLGKVTKKSNEVQLTVCAMLSKPRIFHDSKSEIIKGQAISISCQSVNGTLPITYRLLKGADTFQSHSMNSDEPVVFVDRPTTDVEYQCLAENCHSYPELSSDVLQVKVLAPVNDVKISILEHNEVESGSQIVLHCTVKEGTGPILFKFYREKENKPFYETVENTTYAVWYKENVGKEQEGQYYCTASNRATVSKFSPRSSSLAVRVFLAPWKKGLISMVVILAIIAILIVGIKCYFLRKAKAKQKPVEMSRPAAPFLNSNSEKISESNVEANSGGYNDDAGQYEKKPLNEKKDSLNADVEYTEVDVSLVEPHQAPGTKSTETVYSEIRKVNPKTQRLP